MQANLVSTIIPVYNRAIFLEEAVLSVLAQTYLHYEIILVDDGSTDGTSASIEDLANRYSKVKRVRIDNQGPGGAREAGRQIACGEFIQYLDSDDLLMPRKYEIQVKALRENLDCDIAYGITRLIDHAGNELQPSCKKSGEQIDYLFPELLLDRWWNTHTPLYRRSLCDKIGPWSFSRMGEDWEYDGRAGALRAKLIFCNELVSSHRKHDEGRLTGGKLTYGITKDVASLIPQLYKYAVEAGVQNTNAEMQHFSRWAFLVARQAGGFGLNNEARECFKVACKSTDKLGTSLRLVGAFSHILGWRITSNLCSLRDFFNSR